MKKLYTLQLLLLLFVFLNTQAQVFDVTGTIPKAAINSSYNAVPHTNGCPNVVAVPIPAGVMITAIRCSFDYEAIDTCSMGNAGWDITYNSCHSPSNPVVYTCNFLSSGICFGPSHNVFPDFSTCIPAPQCTPYTMDFSLNFYRCTTPGSACSGSCINAYSDFVITVTCSPLQVSQPTSSVPSDTICRGASIELSDTALSGLPYTLTWSPGNITASAIVVSPLSTTTYTVTASICAGNITAQNTITVNVLTPPCFLGLSELNSSSILVLHPNPAGNELIIKHPQLSIINCQLSITNMLGETVQSAICNLPSAIDVSKLHAGIYFVRIATAKEVWTGRFVKE